LYHRHFSLFPGIPIISLLCVLPPAHLERRN
jgi:hypothetical protein